MRGLKWLFLILLILVSSVSIAHGQTDNELPTLSRIGRGAVQSVEWHSSGDYILVSTVRGAWLYTPDLQDIAHFPDAQLATLSPDGRYIAGVNDAHRILLWDAHTLEPVISPDAGYFQRIWTLAWSPDGRYLVAAGRRDEGLIYAWDFFDSQKVILVSRYSADELLWSPEGHQLAMINTQSGSFYIFNMEERSVPFYYQPTGTLVHGLNAIWQNESHILAMTGGEITDAILWNIVTGEQVDSWRFPSSLAFYNHSGDTLAIGIADGVSISHLEADDWFHIETGPDPFGARMLAWSGDDRWLAVGAYNFSRARPAAVLLVDPFTGNIAHRLGGTRQSIQRLSWSDNDQSLLVVDEQQQMLVYDVASGETLAYNDAHTLVGETLEWNSDGTQIVIAGSHDGVTLWDAKQTTQLSRFSDASLPVTDIKWQPDGDLIAAQAREFSGVMYPGAPLVFQIWNTHTGENVTDIFEFDSDHTVDFFDWRPEGNQIATLSGDTLYIRDVDSGDIVTEATSLNGLGDVRELTWSPADGYIATLMLGFGTGGSYLYDLEAGEFTFSSAPLLYGSVVWTPDDELISLLWGTSGDPAPPRSIAPALQRHNEPFGFFTPDTPTSKTLFLQGLMTNTQQGFLSPNGRYAGAIDDSNNGMVWDAVTGAPLAMLSDVALVVWSPDETRILVQRVDGSLWLLDANGTIRAPFPISASLQQPIGHFFWSPDSGHFAHLYNGVVDLWNLGD